MLLVPSSFFCRFFVRTFIPLFCPFTVFIFSAFYRPICLLVLISSKSFIKPGSDISVAVFSVVKSRKRKNKIYLFNLVLRIQLTFSWITIQTSTRKSLLFDVSLSLSLSFSLSHSLYLSICLQPSLVLFLVLFSSLSLLLSPLRCDAV